MSKYFRFLLILILLIGCRPASTPVADSALTIEQAIERGYLLGQVVDEAGSPVADANVKSGSDIVHTDSTGWFFIPSDGYTQWVSVYKVGYLTRTRAASPGDPVLIRVSLDDGKTAVLVFAGDVMMGRRFFDPNSDGNPEDGLLPLAPTMNDHMALLEPIQPLLRNSDITALNLETVLSTKPFLPADDPIRTGYHPTKEFIIVTDPSAVAALMESGVTVVDLGNNHVYDGLEEGMANTIGFLDKLDLAHFGAGMNESEAWTPAVLSAKGQKIAFVGCTTISGGAEDEQSQEISYTASDLQNKGGAAMCDPERLRNSVLAAGEMADEVVVMIHGGYEYDPLASPNVLRFTEIARKAGADIVVNHHPHVVGGFSWNGESVVARSLGNFIFDQTVWSTLGTYIFTVHVRDGAIIRAYIEPLLIHNNIPRGITGKLADHVARIAAGLESGPFVIEGNTMEVDLNQKSRQYTKQFAFDGGSGALLQIPQNQWLLGFEGNGSILLGRDLLWVGGFERTLVDDTPNLLPLWIQNNSPSVLVNSEFAYSGSAGIRLVRISGNVDDVYSTSLYRIPAKPKSRITIFGMYRSSPNAEATIQLNLYSDTAGPLVERIPHTLNANTPGVWQDFRFDIVVPQDVEALQLYLRLAPPAGGTSTVDFDDLHVIEWAPDGSPFTPYYEYAMVTGQGVLTLAQDIFPGAENWLTLQKTNIEELILDK